MQCQHTTLFSPHASPSQQIWDSTRALMIRSACTTSAEGACTIYEPKRVHALLASVRTPLGVISVVPGIENADGKAKRRRASKRTRGDFHSSCAGNRTSALPVVSALRLGPARASSSMGRGLSHDKARDSERARARNRDWVTERRVTGFPMTWIRRWRGGGGG